MAGAVTLWVRAPPSDHDLNVYDTPPTVCGLGALTLFDEPTITVRVVGAVTDWGPTPSCSPVGVVAKVRFTVLGSSWRLVLACAPAESVAVRTRDSDDGYSWSGAGNVPEATPVKLCTGCVWQLLGQWLSTTDHDSRLAGKRAVLRIGGVPGEGDRHRPPAIEARSSACR